MSHRPIKIDFNLVIDNSNDKEENHKIILKKNRCICKLKDLQI